jgi:hypothetical protein
MPSAAASSTSSHAAMPVLTTVGGGSSPRISGTSHTTATHPSTGSGYVRHRNPTAAAVRKAMISETKIGP